MTDPIELTPEQVEAVQTHISKRQAQIIRQLRRENDQRNALLMALEDVCTQYPLIHPGSDPAWIRNARATLAKARAGA